MTTEDPKTGTKVPKPDAPEAKPGARRRMLRKIAGLLAGFAAAGTILAGLTGYWTTYRTVTKEILAPVKPEQIAPRLSLVVLPFSNLTGNPAQDYLGDVITEELTTSLSRIPHSFIIARSTAFTYKEGRRRKADRQRTRRTLHPGGEPGAGRQPVESECPAH